jgi:hypothetical protein
VTKSIERRAINVDQEGCHRIYHGIEEERRDELIV